MLNRVKEKHFLLFLVPVLLLCTMAFAALLRIDVVSAVPCGHDTATDAAGGCFKDNYDDASANGFKGSFLDYQKLVDGCQGTDSVNPDNYSQYLGQGFLTETGSGNCSNAVRSCFVNATDKTACTDSNVLALASACNEGDVGSAARDGGAQNTNSGGWTTAGCGIDAAIDSVNRMKGTEYQTNYGIYQKSVDDMTAKSCKGVADGKQLTDCKDKVTKDTGTCLKEQGALNGEGGALNSDFDQAQLSSCVIERSASDAECAARSDSKGTWDAATKKCVAPATPSDDANNNGTPDDEEPTEGVGGNKDNSVSGKCGQARTNLLACDGDEGAAVFNSVLAIVLQVLTALIGISAVGGLAYASITYARAGDNASLTSEAKDLIRNIVIGILLYGFLVALINWIVPGGVFGSGGWF